jgi:hypothetical protein
VIGSDVGVEAGSETGSEAESEAREMRETRQAQCKSVHDGVCDGVHQRVLPAGNGHWRRPCERRGMVCVSCRRCRTRAQRHPRAWTRPRKPLGPVWREASSLGIPLLFFDLFQTMTRVTLARWPRAERISPRVGYRRGHAKWATMPPLALREFAVPVMLQSSASPNVAHRPKDRSAESAESTESALRRGDA